MSTDIGSYKRRDKVVQVICNFLLRHVASKRYQMMIDGAMRLGLAAAIKEAKNDAEDETEKRFGPSPRRGG